MSVFFKHTLSIKDQLKRQETTRYNLKFVYAKGISWYFYRHTSTFTHRARVTRPRQISGPDLGPLSYVHREPPGMTEAAFLLEFP